MTPVRVGQIWRDLYPRHTDELRLVRIDRLETVRRKQTVCGLQRVIEVEVARVSSKTGGEQDFTPVNRFIQTKRFGKFYKPYKGLPCSDSQERAAPASPRSAGCSRKA